MDPLSIEYASTTGLIVGLLGALSAGLIVGNGGFHKLPVRLLSKSKTAIEARALFMASYATVGAVSAFFATFWYFGEVNLNKLLALQFAVGALAPTLLEGARLRLTGTRTRHNKTGQNKHP